MKINFLKTIFALFLFVFAINCSFATEFEILSHDSYGSISSPWVPERYFGNITFTINSNSTSLDNITTIEIFNVITPGDDLYNITHLYCPAGWTPTTFEREPIKDSIIDSVYCSSGTLSNGSSVNVVLTIISKDITDNTTTSKDWTVITTDTGASNTTDFFSLFSGIDAKGPAITIISPTSPIGNANYTFNATIIESEVRVDNITNATAVHVSLAGVCNATSLLNSALICDSEQKVCHYTFDMNAREMDGDCNVTLIFNDTFNNTGVTTQTYQIDNTGPVIELASKKELSSGVLITFNITDSPAGVDLVWWTNDSGATNYTLGSGIDTTGWSEGSYTIRVWANDTLGNLGDKITSNGTNSTSIIITIDNTKPNVVINAPNAGTFGNSVFVNVTATDNNTVDYVTATIGSVSLNLTKGSGNCWTGTADVSGLAENTYNLKINASDLAGNYNDGEKVEGIVIDHTKPAIQILNPSEGEEITSGSVTVNANVNENASRCIANFDNLNNDTMTSADKTNWTSSKTLGNGNHKVNVYCSDVAGNWNVSATISFKVYAVSGGDVGSGYVNITGLPKMEIENHKPELTAPYIDNEIPKKGDVITCVSGEFSDEDGDTKAGEQWKWLINGEIFAEPSSKFDTKNANAGDEITCMQRATDGIDYTDWIASSNSAIVQEPAAYSEEKTKTEGNTKPINPFTGAFIGALLEDNLFLTVLAVAVMGGAIAVLTVRYLKRRGLKFKVQ